MTLYLAAFVALFAKGVAAAHGVTRGRAALIGAAAFVVYQVVFVVFNR